jgi:hypothetical protein
LLSLEGWAREGLTDEMIAKKIGIRRETLYVWMKQFPDISNAIKKGKAPVDFQVENALLKRALGYEYEEAVTEIYDVPSGKVDLEGNIVYIQKKHIRKVKKIIPPDATAMIFWLKNRKPAIWRDKPEVSESAEVMSKLDEVLNSIKGVV